MVTKFKTDHKKSIVFCLHDIIDFCESGYAQEICINLTDFLIHRFDLHDFDILIGRNEDELLRTASEENYTHAVVISAGTSLKLSDRLFPAIEETCKKDFFIAGHILDRAGHSYYGNACFELHQQFYIVNLEQYKDAGLPFIGEEEWGKYEQIAPFRSEECLYDDPEIPVWMKQGTELKTYDVRLHGWNILCVALEQGRTLLTLDQSVRTSKKYLYYEYDHVFLKTLTEIKHYQFFATNFFAGWNSDTLRSQLDFTGPVEQYATVGIGFNWIKNLELVGFTENTRVIFTDINYNCLMFMKKLVEEWDGNDYADFYWKHKPMLPNNSSYVGEEYKTQIDSKWKEFLTSVDDWEMLWASVKQLTYDYILIDYTASFNFDWLEAGQKTILNLSNLYNHGPFIAMNSLKYRIYCENRLIRMLKDKDPNITLLLTARAADGFWKTNPEEYLGTVDKFKFTNLQDLKIPDWHETDWKYEQFKLY
jgi:pterin-4a-carbinolamine dehydratase